jgi:hypothetical protein
MLLFGHSCFCIIWGNKFFEATRDLWMIVPKYIIVDQELAPNEGGCCFGIGDE